MEMAGSVKLHSGRRHSQEACPKHILSYSAQPIIEIGPFNDNNIWLLQKTSHMPRCSANHIDAGLYFILITLWNGIIFKVL